MRPRRSDRRLIITVCPREPGTVRLPLSPGRPLRRFDATAIARELVALARARGLSDRVEVREGCAGGCQRPGPNVDVAILALPQPGGRPDHVAVGRKSYVYSLTSLDYLARILDDNLM
jgi:hypothetical protein